MLCGVEKTTVASCIQSLVQRIGEILRGHENVEIDLEDLGKLYCEREHVFFKPMVKSMNMNQHLGKTNVKRLMEIKNKNTNMNFYKMDISEEDRENKRNRSTIESKYKVFKNVSSRLKSLTKATHVKNPDNNWWLKAGPDPLSKDQNFSEFVDRPGDLWNIQIPKPKLAETP